jgi:glyoxylase I family protein
MVLDLNQHANNSGETFDPTRTGLDHLAFNAASYEVLEALAARLDAYGVCHSRIALLEGIGETFDLRDPDGIQLELWHIDWLGTWKTYLQRKMARSRSDAQADSSS